MLVNQINTNAKSILIDQMELLFFPSKETMGMPILVKIYVGSQRGDNLPKKNNRDRKKWDIYRHINTYMRVYVRIHSVCAHV